jgi:hypothetical protein
MEPKYKDLKFGTEKDFEEWLAETATQKIELVDEGQDFLFFWIDKRGEILHTKPFQGSVWNGRIIRSKTIKTGHNMVFTDGLTLKHPVANVEKLNGGGWHSSPV